MGNLVADMEFEAELREKTGKSATKSLRNKGFIPAILYSKGDKPLHVTLRSKEFKKVISLGNFESHLACIKLQGKDYFALPKAIQVNPVTENPEHVDFLLVEPDGHVTVRVPVKIINRAKSIGIKRGGVLNLVRHYIELVCPTGNIPKQIEIDIADKNIGDSIHFSHIDLAEGIESAIQDRDFTVATITGRKAQEEEEAAAEAAEAAAEAGEDKDEAQGEDKVGDKAENKDKAEDADKGKDKGEKK